MGCDAVVLFGVMLDACLLTRRTDRGSDDKGAAQALTCNINWSCGTARLAVPSKNELLTGAERPLGTPEEDGCSTQRPRLKIACFTTTAP